jgi:hypothetical protein
MAGGGSGDDAIEDWEKKIGRRCESRLGERDRAVPRLVCTAARLYDNLGKYTWRSTTVHGGST